MVTLLAGLLWMLFFYRYDDGKREPPARVAVCALLGAAAVAVSIAWERWAAGWIDETTLAGQFVTAFFVVGIGEEACKYGAAWLGAYRRGPRAVTLPVDAVIYAIAAGIGFAAVENVLYARTFGMEVLLLRAVVGFVVHASFAGIFGGMVGIGLHRGETMARAGLKGIASAGLVHGLYDFAILSGWLSPAGVLGAVAALYVLLSSRIDSVRGDTA